MEFVMYETDPTGLENFYRAVIKKYETYAPVESFGRYSFERVQDSAPYQLHPPVDKSLSIKSLFLPQASQVMRFTENQEGVKILPLQEDALARKKVALGVKMCDAQAIKVLEGVMKWDYIDEDFLKRRENTILVADACDLAEPHCFCSSLDFDFQKSDAFDVLIIGARGKMSILKALTKLGDEFLREAASALKPATKTAEKTIQEHFKKFLESFKKKFDYSAVNKAMTENFESPEYDEFGKNCITCKTCAFVCPTCHCFKTVDEKVKDTGVRYKCQDTCTDCNFTLMAGGHNPRVEKSRRLRQRMMHKFVYYKERFGSNLCVGCGRCVSFCPVKIDIFDVVTSVAKKGGKK